MVQFLRGLSDPAPSEEKTELGTNECGFRPRTAFKGNTSNMPNAKKKQQKKKEQKKPQSKPKAGERMVLTPCGRGFARTLFNPCGGKPVCIPDGNPSDSRKAKFFAKGTVTCPTGGGIGFIAFDPKAGSRTGLATANQALWFGNTTYAGSTILQANGTTSVGGELNADYDTSLFVDGDLECRVVSACLRIKYSGSSFYNQGTVVGYSDPDGSSLSGKNAADLLSNDQVSQTTVSQISDRWLELLWKPHHNSENYTSADDGSHSLAFIMSGTSGTEAAVFQYEAYANYEFIGPVARGKTPSVSVPRDFAAVNTAIRRLPNGPMLRAPQHEQSFLQLANKYAHQAANTVENVIDIAETVGPVLSRAFALL